MSLTTRILAAEKQIINTESEDPIFKITTKDGLYNVDCIPDAEDTPTVRGLTAYGLEGYCNKYVTSHFRVDMTSLTDQELRELAKGVLKQSILGEC